MMTHAAFKSYGAFKSVLSTWSDQETLSTPLRLTAGAGAGVVAVGMFALSKQTLLGLSNPGV